jgi:hypothetical protein
MLETHVRIARERVRKGTRQGPVLITAKPNIAQYVLVRPVLGLSVADVFGPSRLTSVLHFPRKRVAVQRSRSRGRGYTTSLGIAAATPRLWTL